MATSITLQFNSLQAIRDRYRDLTAVTTGMNWDLIHKFIKVHMYSYTLYSMHVHELFR